MTEMKLHRMKKLEIIVKGEDLEFILDLLDKAGAPGYTIIHNLSGKGSHGFHEGHLLFNEEDVLDMVIVVTDEEKSQAILEGLSPFFSKHSGVVFVSDVMVSRVQKFKGAETS